MDKKRVGKDLLLNCFYNSIFNNSQRYVAKQRSREVNGDKPAINWRTHSFRVPLFVTYRFEGKTFIDNK